MNARAITYRKLHDIPDSWGTAVNVQAMVFGNLGETSATGVAFTRNPSTGDKELYGEFLVNAQGEDVVAGIRTPQSITESCPHRGRHGPAVAGKLMPETFAELIAICDRLEKHYRDMQDLEFTIQAASCGCCRPARASAPPRRRLKIAVDMAEEGLITERKR
jgi:pyruvate,orthophosphate dikinase